jgi:hypothetical protein
VTEADSVLLLIHNNGNTTPFACVFAINVHGGISFVHGKDTCSIEIVAKGTTAVGVDKWRGRSRGYQKSSEWPTNATADILSLNWPEVIGKDQLVKDDPMVILTTTHVDLGYLGSGKDGQTARGPDPTKAPSPGLSGSSRDEIASGTKRVIGTATGRSNLWPLSRLH